MAGAAAAASSLSPEPSQEVFPWLKTLPLAPEYRPTLAEFQDPIAYIFKIEKEASQYGICKIIPPVPPAPKKTAIGNLNRSLLARAAAAAAPDSEPPAPTFTTRQQQIGFCPRKPRPVQKPVWQSGEYYTFHEFEAKAKNFEKGYLKRYSKKGPPSALEVETLFWKATVDKPFSVEYANDMPGSAFVPLSSKKKKGREAGEGVTVGETPWNMRAVSRAKGSLLRFMKEEIPGVTSPMVYIAMLFSWFAWHVEDHDLHSLNYLHMGAGKTWYGVPRDAAVAFEEVVRLDGYGGEFNPLVTFSTLGEKTTVMSPEVFVRAGIPCCRLVQNAGEFVVTFPRAYHSGFSHGFNFGEAANIATPEWLRVARDAAIRRASINYPPMVSHFQLLYDLALELCSRAPMSSVAKPKSSRLKDKKKSEGETLVKELFVQNLIQNNELLQILGKGSSVVLLPKSSSDISNYSDLRASQLRLNPRMSLGFCNNKEVVKSSQDLASDETRLGGMEEIKGVKGFYSVKGKFASMYDGNRDSSFSGTDYLCRLPSWSLNTSVEKESDVQGDALSDQRLFSCVTCGILCFSCVAVLQPTEQAARYLMSADCSFFNDWTVGSGVTRDGFTTAHGDANNYEQNPSNRWTNKSAPNPLYDIPAQAVEYKFQMAGQSNQAVGHADKGGDSSALGLLASTYGNSSDSEEDHVEANATASVNETNSANGSPERNLQYNDPGFSPGDANRSSNPSLSRLDSEEAGIHVVDCYSEPESRRVDIKSRSPQAFDHAVERETNNFASRRSNSLEDKFRDPITASNGNPSYSLVPHGTDKTRSSKTIVPMENANIPFAPRSDEDSSRMHVFCLEHAIEVEQQLRQIGGAHVFLLCHPEYPKIEAEAKLVAEELELDYSWNDILFADATKEDEERIKSALDSEEAIPGNGDWAVKLGINLFYSANLSRSTLYSKQMPYNCVIYSAFGRNSLGSSPTKLNVYGRRSGGRQRKVVAGKWCGKVWMSNQVHPFLSQRDPEEQEQERSFPARATSDENHERKPENVHKAETTKVAKKSNRKRKMRPEIASRKKVKCIETKGAVSDDSLDGCSLRQQQRIIRGKRPRLVEKEEAISYDSLEDDSLTQHKNLSRKKEAKFTVREDDESEDVEEEFIDQQHWRNIRGKQGKYIEDDDAVSGDSLDESSLKQYKRIPRGWQAKFMEREDAESDEELEETSHKLHRKIPSGRQIKSFERDDAISDDSRAEIPLKQYRRMPKGRQAKFFGRDEALSDDASEDGSQHQLRRISRGKQMKCIERDGAFSDDSLGDIPQQQRRKIPRSKAAKFTNREAFDSLKGNSHQQRRRVPRSQLTKFIEREDAVTSDSQGDSSPQQPRRIPRSKQTKVFDREVAVSDDDSVDDTSQQQLRKTPRSRQGKFIEKEDAVSYDSLDENFQQPGRRTLRSTKKKTQTPRQIKQETPQNVKQGKRCITKHVAPQQMKQESRNRNAKIEQSATQCNSYDEDEIEGGPSTRLRKRVRKPLKESLETKPKEKKQASKKKVKNASNAKTLAGHNTAKVRGEEAEYECDMEGCSMSFGSKQELVLHKRNICPVKGCGKKFFSHKYLVQHRRVHMDDRPLQCPWKGCKMTFKWAWARTEHIRVHTGARPYVCAEEGCGQTFRFVSDFSRHKRKTGHSTKKGRG